MEGERRKGGCRRRDPNTLKVVREGEWGERRGDFDGAGRQIRWSALGKGGETIQGGQERGWLATVVSMCWNNPRGGERKYEGSGIFKYLFIPLDNTN